MAVPVMSALTRAVSWTAGLVEGLVTGLLRGRPGTADLPLLEAGGPFDELRAALLGRHRRHIVRALGEPPTACLGFGVAVAGASRVTFWQATTWYYPFDPSRRQAIAIRFVADHARHVEFIVAETAGE